MIKYILFDFDGTIADTLPSVEIFIKQKNISPKITINDIRDLGIKGVIKRENIPVWKIPGFVKDYKKFMNKQIGLGLRTFKGMPLVLDKLHDDFRLGILTSNSKENVEAFLKNNNLREYFSFIYSDSSIFGKSIVLKRLLRELKLNRNEVIYIGDEDRDIIASKKTGIKNIAVTWGYNSEKRLKKVNPDFIVKSPREIIKKINNL